MKNKIYHSVILTLFVVLLCSCGGATEFEEDAPHNKPIQNTLQLGIVGFQKAISEIPPSTIVGGFYTGWAKVLRQKYYASGFVDERFQRTYEDVVVAELKKAKYETDSKNVIFDTVKNNPRFLVGAAITDGRLNYYLVQSSNGLITYENNADALLQIRWELFDSQEKKIIYQQSELGTYRDAESDLYAYRECVRISFRNFLAEKALVEAFSKYIQSFPPKL